MLLLEAELGGPWTDFYSELTPKPIAAASLGQVSTSPWPACLDAQREAVDGRPVILNCAQQCMIYQCMYPQVYKGRLKDGTPVAVKVQRPHVVETVSVDLFIIR
jgi:predicted unusual protein kinase regulating ubiquinone biosynthesis (AarF/ABC1/UbiB family)